MEEPMTADARPLVPEELLAHAGFVRTLAAKLLSREDQDDVEDVAQSTWLAKLRSRTIEPASARTWLGRVVRNLVFERHRTEVARDRRERAAASPEALVSAHELAAKDEVLRLVADAVLALDEKHRAVLLLRFYDGSPTAEVAQRLGLPLETTRSRLKRALALLREELDRRAAGGREQWLGALASALQFAPATGVTATAKLALSVALAAVLVGGIWIGTHVARTSGAPTAAASAPVATAAPPVAAAPAPAPTRAAETSSPTPPAAAAGSPAVASAPAAAVGTLRVSVVDANGRVVPDRATLSVRPAGSKDAAKSVSGTLDRDHPQLALDDAPAGEVDVEVKLDHRPQGTLKAVATVREKQVTELALPYGGPDPATTVCVRLDRFAVLERIAGTLSAADGNTIASSFVAESSPFLVFEGVSTSAYTLKIADPRFRPVEVVGLHAGDAIAVTLVGSAGLHVVVRKSAGAPPITSARFTCSHESEQLPGFVVEASFAAVAPRPDGSFSIDGLVPDSFVLVVHVEGEVTRRVPIAALAPGDVREIEVVLDAAAQAGSIAGVLFASDAVTPLEGAKVELYAPAKVDDSADSGWFFATSDSGEDGSTVSFGGGGMLDDMRVGKARATTDAAGRFRFAGLATGRWILRHVSGAGIDTVLDSILLDDDHPLRDDVELVESEGATIAGRLVTSVPADFTKLAIKVAMKPKSMFSKESARLQGEGAPIAADGSFRIGPLPPGPTELRIDDVLPVTVRGMNSDVTVYSTSADGVPLAKVDVPSSGEVKLDVAADAFVPGTLKIAIVVDGAPSANLLAVVTRRDPAHPDFTHGVRSDAEGRVVLGPMLPGALSVAVSSPIDGWTVADALKVELPARGAVDGVVTVRTFQGAVTILDAAGAVLRNRVVFVGTPLDEFNSVDDWKELRTDAEGRITLRRPVGKAAFVANRDEMEAERIAVVGWTTEGSSTPQVRLH
jgi:RNA polymerase sigma-70 factor (ECF subfamily)